MNSITLSRTSKQLDCWIYLINENFFSPSGFFAEPNWGLPLAIAANLHTPYRIEVGIEKILNIEYKDKEGKGKCVEMGEETSAKFSWFSFNLNANSLIGSSYLGERNLCWLSCWPTRKLLHNFPSRRALWAGCVIVWQAITRTCRERLDRTLISIKFFLIIVSDRRRASFVV